MAVVGSSRAALESALANSDNRVMVLVGARDSVAGRIHDFLETRDDLKEEIVRKWFLVPDSSVLTATQRRDWFGDQVDRFAVLRDDPKRVAANGEIQELLRGDGAPSILRIRRAFARRASS